MSDSSHGVVKVPPLHRLRCRCPLPVTALLRRAVSWLLPEGSALATRRHIRPGAATSRTRSALAVSLGFGGLLHLALCRFVAPCCRSWGSPCFGSLESSRAPDRLHRLDGVEALKQPRFVAAIHPHPEGAAFRQPLADIVSGLGRPRGVSLASVTRLAFVSLGPFPMALHPSKLSPRPQLFHVTRAFQPHSRPSARPRADPVGVSCLKRWSALWLGSPQSLPSRRCSWFLPAALFPPLAKGVCSAGSCRSLDLKAFVR